MSDQHADSETTVADIIAERCDIESEQLTESTRFDGDLLDADSLDLVEMAEAIDASLGLFIPDEDLEEFETVGDVQSYVRDAI